MNAFVGAYMRTCEHVIERENESVSALVAERVKFSRVIHMSTAVI